MREFADLYISCGLIPIPLYSPLGAGCTCGKIKCHTPGKHPAVFKWQEYHPNPTDFTPSHNIGLRMGEGLVALDVDGPEGRASLASLETDLGKLPITLTSKSGRVGGGEHRIFRLPRGADDPGNKVALRPGLDVRGKGGQIVVWPSRHASGALYTWTNVMPPAILPEVWCDLLNARAKPLTRETLAECARAMARNSKPQAKAMALSLKALIAGEPYAEPGQRDEMCWELVKYLARSFPNVSPKTVEAYFAQSHQVMSWEPADMAGKIARVWKDHAVPTDKIKRRQEAFGSQRTDPYTGEELENMARDHGIQHLDHYWILQYLSAYYILTPQGYRGPYPEAAITAATQSYLSPSPCVLDDELGDPKGARKLVQEYGSPIAELEMSLCAQVTRFEPVTRKLVYAACPLRVIEPRYDEAIMTWLERLAPRDLPLLLKWIARVTVLEHPTPALYLTGPPGTGKSLLFHGLSRLWCTTGPTALVQAIDNFNEGLATCPLVFADESLPTDFRGQSRTRELREFIQARTRTHNKKYAPKADLTGCIRLGMASNSKNMISFKESLNVDDQEALAERIIRIQVEPTRDYLTTQDTLAWVEDDRIAAFALFLRDALHVEQEGRFWIKSPDRSFAKIIGISTDLRSQVCQMLVDHLLLRTQSDLLLVRDGELLCTSKGILKVWSLKATPSLREISQEITGMSLKRRHVRGIQMHQIDPEVLHLWNEENAYADPEEIRNALTSTPGILPTGKGRILPFRAKSSGKFSHSDSDVMGENPDFSSENE